MKRTAEDPGPQPGSHTSGALDRTEEDTDRRRVDACGGVKSASSVWDDGKDSVLYFVFLKRSRSGKRGVGGQRRRRGGGRCWRTEDGGDRRCGS